jgi:hypothetical protein
LDVSKFFYTYLTDKELGLTSIWGWAKKLIQDLNKRDAEVDKRITTLEDATDEGDTDSGSDGTVINQTTVDGDAVLTVLVTDPQGDDLTSGDGKIYIPIDATLDGREIKAVSARISTVSALGPVTVMLRRVRDGISTDLLTTAITIDEGEKSSEDAVTPPAIDATTNPVVTDDENWVDVDAHGTYVKGLTVTVVYGEVE